MRTPPIKAIIFDMGGVILRTRDHKPRELLAKTFGTTRAKLEKYVFMSPSSLQSEIGMISNDEHWQNVLDHFGVTDMDTGSAYAQFFSGDEVNEELLAYIEGLKPQFKIALLSNAWEGARENLAHFFNFLECFETSLFSYEIGVRKPDAEIFAEILCRLQINPQEAIFIDDFEENVIGAQKAGLSVVHYKNNEKTINHIVELTKKTA